MLNCGLLVMWFPEIWKSERAGAAFFLAAIGFAFLAPSSFVTLVVFKSRVAIAQLGLSLVGLACMCPIMESYRATGATSIAETWALQTVVTPLTSGAQTHSPPSGLCE